MFVSFLPSLDPRLILDSRRSHSSVPGARFFAKSRQALAAVLPVLGLKPGDVVLAPASLCWDAISPLLASRLRVRCYPLDEQLRPDLDAMRSMIDCNTRAVLVVHYYGFAQDIVPIEQWCRATGLKLIEDCALCLYDGCSNGGVGRSGDAAFFSLWKFLPIPDGSVLLVSGDSGSGISAGNCDDAVCRPLLRLLAARAALYGLLPMRTFKRRHKRGGGVSSETVLPTPHPMSKISRRIHARIDVTTVAQLRRRNYQALAALLSADRRITLVWPQLGEQTVPNAMLIRVDDPCRLQARLLAHGFETELPINRFFSGIAEIEGAVAYPAVDDLAGHVLALPVHQDLALSDVEAMSAAVRSELS